MLDQTDFAIIDALQNDARQSNKDLAEQVGLAPSSCLERVRRLRESGVLTGVHSEVDPTKLGVRLQAMIAITLESHRREATVQLEEDLMAMREVIAIYHVSGETDYLVHVAVSDADHLRRVALDAFGARSEIRDIQTALIFGHRRSWIMPNYLA